MPQKGVGTPILLERDEDQVQPEITEAQISIIILAAMSTRGG